MYCGCAKAYVYCRVADLCKRRIMLTGTPLQNDLAELQNLLAFLLPSVFNEEAENLEQLTADMQVKALWLRC